jgi:hypothetical protein
MAGVQNNLGGVLTSRARCGRFEGGGSEIPAYVIVVASIDSREDGSCFDPYC